MAPGHARAVMEWTKPLSVAMVVLVGLLVVGSAIELLRTTFGAGDAVAASVVTMGLVAIALLAAIVVGARSRRWLQNPDHYW